jgi:hypothetical protein
MSMTVVRRHCHICNNMWDENSSGSSTWKVNKERGDEEFSPFQIRRTTERAIEVLYACSEQCAEFVIRRAREKEDEQAPQPWHLRYCRVCQRDLPTLSHFGELYADGELFMVERIARKGRGTLLDHDSVRLCSRECATKYVDGTWLEELKAKAEKEKEQHP